MKEYEYLITTKKVMPPIGRIFHYVASVVVYEQTDKGRHRVSHCFSETHGRTEDEAHRNMEERVVSWIKENNPEAKYNEIL